MCVLITDELLLYYTIQIANNRKSYQIFNSLVQNPASNIKYIRFIFIVLDIFFVKHIYIYVCITNSINKSPNKVYEQWCVFDDFSEVSLILVALRFYNY